jgi:hypothetical protein
MILSIKYFITLVTLSSKALNFFLNIPCTIQFFFPIHGGCWVIGFKVLEVDAVLGMV